MPLDNYDAYQVGPNPKLIGASGYDPRRVINVGKGTVSYGATMDKLEGSLAPSEAICTESCLFAASPGSTLIVEHITAMPKEEPKPAPKPKAAAKPKPKPKKKAAPKAKAKKK